MLPSGTGRHRRPRPTPAAVVTVATAAATGAGIALPLLGATAAHAADNGTWDKVAVCETGGLWSADTGDGFFGGLAITQATWDQYGGDTYAARPDLASRAQQITVAEKILADLGPEAWPGCESGLLTDTSTPSVDPGTPDPSGTLPGLPSGTLTPNPGASVPGGSGGSGGSGTTGGTGTATPGTPSGGATTAPGGGSGGGNPDGGGSGGAGGTSAPGTTTAPPTAGIPGTGAPGGTAGTGTPASPGTTTPPGPDAPPATADSGGRHGKPYSPTDEQLAAQDRATRTEVRATTTTGGDGAQSGTAGGSSGTGANTGANTGGNAGSSGSTGASGTTDSSTAPDSYTVVGGDSLSGIAGAHHLGGGWHALYDANRSVIGTDPNLIKPGQILNLG